MSKVSKTAREPIADTEAKEETKYAMSEAVSAVKKPPPEDPRETNLRSLVLLSFWVIVIFFGLPVWWWTTSIHRSRLPLSEMQDWADGKVIPQGRPFGYLQLLTRSLLRSASQYSH
jgi:phosphatidylinositol glycan class S